MHEVNHSINGTEEPWVAGHLIGVHVAYTISVGLLAIPINLLLLVATTRHPQSRQHCYHLYIANYGAINILESLFNVGASITDMTMPQLHRRTHSTSFCQVWGFVAYYLGCTEVNALLLITLNRYISVVHPQRSAALYEGVRNNALLLLAGWIFYFPLLLPPLLGAWGHMGFDPLSNTCRIFNTDGYITFLMCCILLITVPTIVFCYGSVVWVFHSNRKRLSQASKTGTHKLVIAVAATVLTYFILYVPFMILSMLSLETDSKLLRIASYLLASRTAAQPTVFSALSPQVRELFKSKALHSVLQRNPPAEEILEAGSYH